MSVPRPSALPADSAAACTGGDWLTPLSGHWIEAARTHLPHHAQLIRVTIVAMRGSAPREPGASMLVDAIGTMGTIGGGQLEWRAIRLARELLDDSSTVPVRLVDLILGPDLGQCCGGRVGLWLERLTRADSRWLTDAARRLRTDHDVALATDVRRGASSHRLLPSPSGTARLQLIRRADDDLGLLETLGRARPALWIFGAGHVGQALVRLLVELALFEITWIDSRADVLPDGLPAAVNVRLSDSPALLAAQAPPGTRFVVMTHDHGLDYELCRAILQRDDTFWLGLIGSASKSARFRSRLLRAGVAAGSVARLHCPIGVAGIASKLPAAIAIAIAAQLLQQPIDIGITPPPRAQDVCAALPACNGCGAVRES